VEESGVPTTLTPEFEGVSASYGNTLLFIGYEVNGLVEIVVYPGYRFGSDDRVQGHLGYLHVPYGTPWPEILLQVDAIYEHAQRNYRVAVSMRSSDLRSRGAQFESAYDTIVSIFRECWHGFSLRLRREGQIVKEGVTFEGRPPGPVLATWRKEKYTLVVFTTGSILLVAGDRRRDFEGPAGGGD
jgi:hypothetical protein